MMTRYRLLRTSVAILAMGLMAAPNPARADKKEAPAQDTTYDLVVYGGSSAGIAAAVQMKRMGGTVIVIEPSQRIGGLTTGGLGQTDIGNKHVIGGIAREFYQQVRQWYNKPEAWKWEKQPEGGAFKGTGQSVTEANEDTLWTFEPSAALRIYQRWVQENDILVVYGERLDRSGETRATNNGEGFWTAKAGTIAKGVIKEGNAIKTIVMESGKKYTGKMFMDATYEGDLMASSGVSYTIGREGRAIYDETLNGVQIAMAKHHQFVDGVDPYVVKGDANSGLLPFIDTAGPDVDGASDHRSQAFCFRMCLTDVKENQIPFKKPEGYNELWYELLFRNYEAGAKGTHWINSMMPNRKTDTNNAGGFSTDFIGQNYGWPEGTYDERVKIRAEHLLYQQGLMWTLANHSRIPESVRNVFSKWGMTKDEFPDGEGWQEQLYIREGRRMISSVVMTQLHCQGIDEAENSVGMGAYNMDSHNTQRRINEKGHVKNEGDVQVRVSPYPIAYQSIVPREEECTNLVVPIALSASHISFGSIRMEPVFMILGQSGATAVMHALAEGTSLQKVDQAKLKARLIEDKQILNYESVHKYVHLKKLEGIVVDETQATLTGAWVESIIAGGVHKGYHQDQNREEGPCKAVYNLKATEAGTYAVQMASVPNGNRSSKTKVSISTAEGVEELAVNQKKTPEIDSLWIPLKEVKLEKGAEVVVTISNDGADGFVVVDAVRLLPKK